MKILGLAFWLALPGASASLPSATPATRAVDASVVAEMSDGRQWWSVSAQSASLERLLWQIARKSGRRVEGYDAMENPALVTVELVRRPLDQVLEYILGSVGMMAEVRANAVVVLGEPVQPLTAIETLDHVALSWLKVTTRFPDHAAAPSARLAQGEVAELQGNLGAARAHYQTLVEDYPNTHEIAAAMMRTGRILQRLGHWSQASVQYRTLIGLEKGAEHHAAARLELARCSIELGDPQSALHMLTALEAHYPGTTATERTGRQLVRAEALNARDRHMEALRCLDDAKVEIDHVARHDALRIRAMALEGVGLPGEAGAAWLLYAAEASGAQRSRGYEEAARLALQADDELGALFVCQQATNDGFGSQLRRYKVEARRRLGFDDDVDVEPATRAKRIDRAEEWIATGSFDRASEVLQPLFLARGVLEEGPRARVSVGWAACLENRQGLDSALSLLAEERSTFTEVEARARIDVGAARLLEKHDLFDRAIDAYRGNY